MSLCISGNARDICSELSHSGADRQSVDRLAIKAFAPIVGFAHGERNDLHRPEVKRSIDFVSRHQVGPLDAGIIRNRRENFVPGSVRWLGLMHDGVAGGRVAAPGQPAVKQRMAQGVEIAAGQPFGRVFEVLQFRLDHCRPGPVLLLLLDVRHRLDVFSPVNSQGKY